MENISLTVSLCDGPNDNKQPQPPPTIHIELYFINLKTIKKFQKRKIGRRSNTDNNNNYHQTNRIWSRMINRKLSKRSRNYRKLLVLEQYLFHSLINSSSPPTTLQQQQSRITFGNGIVFQPGLYIIQLELQQFPFDKDDDDYKKSDDDILLQLYLNSMANSSPYPILPPVASIMIKQIESKDDTSTNQSSSAVEIWWNPIPISPASTIIDQNYEYCLLITKQQPAEEDDGNHYRRYKDKCSIEQIPIESDRSIRICSNQTKIFVNNLLAEQLYFVDVFVRNLKHSNGGMQSKYWTTNFTLIDYHRQQQQQHREQEEQKNWQEKSSLPLLHDSLFTGIFLDSKNQYRKRFLFKLPILSSLNGNDQQQPQKLYIYIQPCSGLGPIQLNVEEISLNYFDQLRRRRRRQGKHHHHHRRRHRQDNFDNSINDDDIMDEEEDNPFPSNENSILFFDEIIETRTIEINVPIRSNYQIINTGLIYLIIELNTVSSMQTRSMIMLLTNSLVKFPFPRLPQDKSIRVMETLKQCDSITLVWNASPDERVTYCILQRDAKYGHSFEESKNFCQKIKSPPPSTIDRQSSSQNNDLDDMIYWNDRYQNEHSYPTRKVLCRRYRTQKRINNDLIMQQIKKLQPGRQYIFMIQIKGRKNQLNYEQIYVETKNFDECLSSSSSNWQNGNDENDDGQSDGLGERRKRWRGRSL
uniref:Uncharacterized protein LOC113797735 n=1 Tax=Dermatophagoides pteronyssinus TaxID=6956 RepID=A0A6P6YGM3_DERPT|nr:uncharacterized protein LOC113797735 [Dermatophagoides pteronyssinus]